jgi:hypothetical protein
MPIFRKGITASSLRNYFFRDKGANWIGRKPINIRLLKNNKPPPSSQQVKEGRILSNVNISRALCYRILRQGRDFEKSIVDTLRQKYQVECGSGRYTERGYNRTLLLMKSGVEIIHSACVKDKTLEFYGIADLLIRNDIFDRYFVEYKYQRKTVFSHPYHYIVVEIKNKSFKIEDGGFIRSNRPDILACKTQVYVYTVCVRDMQDDSSQDTLITPKAYFIGKYYISKDGVFDSLTYNKLPMVDFDNNLSGCSIKTLTKRATRWIRENSTVHPP